MKQILVFVMLIAFGITRANAQTVDNRTSCDIKVTAICYDITQCSPPSPPPSQCNTTTGNSVGVPNNSTTGAPGCNGPNDVVVAYQVCWDKPTICNPGPCITVGVPDAGGNVWGAGCPDCWSTNTPPGPWTWNIGSDTLPACGDCVQPGGGNATVTVDAAGNVVVQ